MPALRRARQARQALLNGYRYRYGASNALAGFLTRYRAYQLGRTGPHSNEEDDNEHRGTAGL